MISIHFNNVIMLDEFPNPTSYLQRNLFSEIKRNFILHTFYLFLHKQFNSTK